MIPVTIAFGVSLIIVAAIVWRVDDWSRDWNTNHAALADDSEDPLLRPQELSVTPHKLRQLIAEAVDREPAWDVLDVSETDGTVRMHLIHTTRLMRFTDDVHLKLSPVAGGTRVDATSRSRIGKGDLGQNPRNLRSLVRMIKDVPSVDK